MGTVQWVKKLSKPALVIITIIPMLTGCWDRLEIEERAAILGIAIDTANHEDEKEEPEISHTETGFPEPQKEMIRLTVQISIPGRMPLGPGEGGGDSGGKPVWVINAVGHTLDDAVSNLQQQVGNRLFLGHLRVIVVSEKLALKGIREFSDFLRRNSEVRRAAWLVIAQGRAEDYMNAAPELERIPTLYLLSTLDEAVRMGKFPNDFLGIFWSNFSKLGQDPYLPYITLKEKENIEISGLAYFREDKMAGVTKPLEIGFFMAIMNINPGGYKGLTTVSDQDGFVMFDAVRRKSQIQTKIMDGKPKAIVKVHIEGDISEKSEPEFEIDRPETLKKISDNVARGGEEGQKGLIAKTQKAGSDIFGFGEYIRAKHPQYWNEHIRTKEGWRKMYGEMPIDVHMTVDIRRVGMKAR